MNSKKQPSKKVVDISRPKKRTARADAPSAPQLVIPKRSLIIPIEDSTEDTLPQPEPTTARQAVKIEPRTAPALPNTEEVPAPTSPAAEAPGAKLAVAEQPAPEPTPLSLDESKPAPAAASRLEPQPAPDPAPPAKPTATAPQPTNTAPSPAQEVPETEPEPEPEPAPETPAPNTKPVKAPTNAQKALEDAKREQEIQGYIENHDYFVPINARARKRSLRVSIGLTFLELLLGLFLLNLMLDAGIIQLLEKIPHTNLFDLHV